MTGTDRSVGGFKAPVRGQAGRLGPEHNWWFWNPNRVGARPAPDWFQAKLREVDPEGFVDVRWNPIAERWAAFYRKPNLHHNICSGWQLLMKVQHDDGSYMPLDERLLAALYAASGRKWGNGREYFLAIEREMERDRAAKERRQKQEAVDLAMPTYEHSQISVSMAGQSNGSKFSKYHS